MIRDDFSDRRVRTWSIILAGGEGERIKPFLRWWLGEVRPKQYCTFFGTRSLLQHTVERADRVSSPSHRIVVAAEHHAPHLREQMRVGDGGRIVLQPRNCGTAPGIFLPLTCILARDPRAMVTIYPSDHFVHPEEAFTDAVAGALRASTELGGMPVVLGVPADAREADYGWIQPGEAISLPGGLSVSKIERFVEKPEPRSVRDVRGAFWNTLVMAGSVQWLWRLGWRYVPEIMALFVQLWERVDTPGETAALRRIYEQMPQRDFSADILQKAVRHLAVMSLKGVYWSDWGREERVLESLVRFGIRPPVQGRRIEERSRKRGHPELELAHEPTPSGNNRKAKEAS